MVVSGMRWDYKDGEGRNGGKTLIKESKHSTRHFLKTHPLFIVGNCSFTNSPFFVAVNEHVKGFFFYKKVKW